MKQSFNLSGYYRDVLRDRAGRVLTDSGWRSNLIVQNCNRLLAALMKGQTGMSGILYWAIGEGQSGWDSEHPRPGFSDDRLYAELLRQEISPVEMVYLDDENQPSEEISHRLQISAEFRGEDIVTDGFQPLREFGLFGGNATSDPDSGLMVDYVIHPRIDLTADVTLARRLRLTFLSGAVERRELAGFGIGLSVNAIDGVGEVYGSELSDHGVRSIGDLLKLDPLRPVGRIPAVKLREFCLKARMVAICEAELLPLEPLAELSISRFLQQAPEEIVNAIGVAGITVDEVRKLQQDLAALQVAMDDAEMQRLTLGDLMAECS